MEAVASSELSVPVAPMATAKPGGSPEPRQSGGGQHKPRVKLLLPRGGIPSRGLGSVKTHRGRWSSSACMAGSGGTGSPPARHWTPLTSPRLVPQTSHGSETGQTANRQETRSVCPNGLARASSQLAARARHLQPSHFWAAASVTASCGGCGGDHSSARLHSQKNLPLPTTAAAPRAVSPSPPRAKRGQGTKQQRANGAQRQPRGRPHRGFGLFWGPGRPPRPPAQPSSGSAGPQRLLVVLPTGSLASSLVALYF